VTPERPRRVVLAAEVDAEPTGNVSEVRLAEPVTLAHVAAALVDAEGVSGDLAQHELGWYAVQEIGALLRG